VADGVVGGLFRLTLRKTQSSLRPPLLAIEWRYCLFMHVPSVVDNIQVRRSSIIERLETGLRNIAAHGRLREVVIFRAGIKVVANDLTACTYLSIMYGLISGGQVILRQAGLYPAEARDWDAPVDLN